MYLCKLHSHSGPQLHQRHKWDSAPEGYGEDEWENQCQALCQVLPALCLTPSHSSVTVSCIYHHHHLSGPDFLTETRIWKRLCHRATGEPKCSSTGLAVAVERDMLAAGPCLQHELNLVGANSGLSNWIRIQVNRTCCRPASQT